MTSSNEKSVDMFDVKDFRRDPVPSTEVLQASILESAQKLQQQSPSMDAPSSKLRSRRLFSWFRPLFHSTALAAIAIVVTVGLFAVDVGDNPGAPEPFSENDLEWQELMLIEDDLLFAQL